MIQLHSLELLNHPFLGDIKIEYSSINNYLSNTSTSVLIGPNGTGKSNILSITARILNDFFIRASLKTNSDSSLTNLKFLIRFSVYKQTYEYYHNCTVIKEKSILQINRKSRKDFKNISKINFAPISLIASSFMFNDRYAFSSRNDGFYHYIGLKSASNAIYISTVQKNVITNLLNIRINSKSIEHVESTLSFLNYKNFISCEFRFSSSLLFQNKTNINIDEFKKYLIKRKSVKSRVFRSAKYQSLTEDEVKIKEFLDFLNLCRRREENGYFKFDIIGEINEDTNKLELLRDAISYNLILPSNIILQKQDKINYYALSSGEQNIFSQLINISSKVTQSSLIFIDEPEISLHPNWQVKYLDLLHKIFSSERYQLIIATHSHFLISDLNKDTSQIITLSLENDHIISDTLSYSPYGWSPENILYRVFRLASQRNFFVDLTLRKLIKLINDNTIEIEKFLPLLSELENIEFTKDDPINLILNEIEAYVAKL